MFIIPPVKNRPTILSLLLVLFLLFAQLAVAGHAVEHALGEREGLPPHVCELCLAAHDLGAGLPSLAIVLQLEAACIAPESLSAVSRASFPAPIASQRGPPEA